MQKTIWDKIGSILLILNGIICLVFAEQVLGLLPTICGLSILIKGIIKFVEGIKNEEYKSLEKINFERSIATITIGIGILLKQEEALFIVGMFWGLSGIMNAVNAFNVAFYNMSNNKKYLVKLIRGIVEFVLSLVLIFDPFASNVGHHIIILGLELVLEGMIELFAKEEGTQNNSL